jgi:hypothetical protein
LKKKSNFEKKEKGKVSKKKREWGRIIVDYCCNPE